ncbi:TetR/AcrR family transcriptional regulator [Lachnospiraceae bacterium LCP25S3_G4]
MSHNEMMKAGKNHVIDTAVEVYKERGILNTTRKDIAEKAGVTVRTLNKYFGAKENLISIVAKRVCEKDIQIREEHLKLLDAEHMTGLQIMGAIIDFEYKQFIENPQERMLVREMSVYVHRQSEHFSSMEQVEYNNNLFYIKTKYLQVVLEKGVADGSIRKDLNCEIYAVMLGGTIWGILEKGSGLIDNIAEEECRQRRRDMERMWVAYRSMVLKELQS